MPCSAPLAARQVLRARGDPTCRPPETIALLGGRPRPTSTSSRPGAAWAAARDVGGQEPGAGQGDRCAAPGGGEGQLTCTGPGPYSPTSGDAVAHRPGAVGARQAARPDPGAPPGPHGDGRPARAAQSARDVDLAAGVGGRPHPHRPDQPARVGLAASPGAGGRWPGSGSERCGRWSPA